MLPLLSQSLSRFGNFFKRRERLADHQVLYAYAPQSLLFPFCAYVNRQSGFLFDLFAGLVERDQEGRFLGDLAEAWAGSLDRKTWRFTIRPEACWSNGEPVLAEDFVRTTRFLLKHQLLSPVRFERIAHELPLQRLHEVIEGHAPVEQLGVSAEGERTLCFHLSCAMDERLMLAAVSELAFFPIYRDYLDVSHLSFLRQSDTKSIQGTSLITTGPFLLSKQKIQNGAMLERNPYYWNHRNVKLERIIYTFSLPHDLGKVDWFRFQFAYLRDFPNWLAQFRENLHIYTPHCPFFMFFNLRDSLLSSKNVRKAIQHLVVCEKNDYFPYLSLEPFLPKELREVMQFEKRLNPILTLGEEERLARARQFLTLEGFSEKNPLNLVIAHTETYVRLIFKEMLLARFKPIPFIHVTFQFVDREALGRTVEVAHQFQLYCDKWHMPIESPLFPLLTQAGNRAQQLTGFENRRYTQLCHQLLGDASLNRQEPIYKELFGLLHEEVPYVTLGYFCIAFYHQSHVGGIKGGKTLKQTLLMPPKNKMLYRLEVTNPRSPLQQRAFEVMVNDVMKCPS